MPNKRWLRIIPVATIMYAIAFISRTNISQALPSMSRDLQLNALQAGTIAGVFFWGYLLLQIPGGYLATHWSTKWFVSILLVAWGTCAVGTGLVHSWREAWIARLLLGVCEGGMYPATLTLIAHWFPRTERARAAGCFLVAVPLSTAFASPLSGWLLDRWDWRVMLVVEGFLPLCWFFVWIWAIKDYPSQAKWLSTQEREYLETEFKKDSTVQEPVTFAAFFRALLAPEVLLLGLIGFLALSGQLGYLFWLPSAIQKSHNMSNLRTGVLYTIPFLVGALALVLNSSSSDKKRERRWHVALPLALGGIFLFGSVLTIDKSPMIAFVLVSLAAVGPFAWLGPFWAIPTERFSFSMKGPVAGVVNSLGHLGGFFGPFLVGYLSRRTGNFAYGFGALASLMILGAILCFVIKPVSEDTPVTPANARVPAKS